MKKIVYISFILLVGFSLAGCDALGGGGANPIAAIQSPTNGATYAVGDEVPVIVAANETSGAGIARVEIFINGALFNTQNSPSGADVNFTPTVLYYPAEEGGVNIMAIAYTPAGEASAPAMVTLNIGAVGDVPVATPEEPAAGWVQGEVSTDSSALRKGPGIYCDIIASLDLGTVINLMEYSDDDQWFMTDFLGPEEIGWIWIDNVTILGSEEDIIHGIKKGCLGCGDGVCSPEIDENCANCSEDCGSCCGNGVCEGGLGETCSTCRRDCGSCCGNGTCEGGLGETCSTCETDCGSCCGNDICEFGFGESCYTCETDCGACCGNGVCDSVYGENQGTCCQDCLGCLY